MKKESPIAQATSDSFFNRSFDSVQSVRIEHFPHKRVETIVFSSACHHILCIIREKLSLKRFKKIEEGEIV